MGAKKTPVHRKYLRKWIDDLHVVRTEIEKARRMNPYGSNDSLLESIVWQCDLTLVDMIDIADDTKCIKQN